LNRYFKLYKAIAKQTLLNLYQYKFATYSWLVGKILEPLVFLIIWKTIAETGRGIGGFDTNYFVTYYLILMVVGQFTFTFLIWDFEKQIISGEFSNKLILPIHPVHYDLAENIGYKIFSMPVIIIATVALGFYFKARFNGAAVNLLVFCPVVLLSFLLRFVVEWTISLSALWLTRSRAINDFYYILLLFFSGRVAPLEVLPSFIKNIANYLPFRFMISYPIEIVLNPEVDPAFLIKNTLILILWLGLALLLLFQVYNRGIKKYTAVGV